MLLPQYYCRESVSEINRANKRDTWNILHSLHPTQQWVDNGWMHRQMTLRCATGSLADSGSQVLAKKLYFPPLSASPTLELRMMWALTMAANSSWWSGLKSHCCLSADRELRALSVGQNMVSGLWTGIVRTGSKPAACKANDSAHKPFSHSLSVYIYGNHV